MTGYLFIVNPAAREGKVKNLWKITERYIDELGLDAQIEFTKYVGHGIEIARDKGSKNDIRVAVGGDGTANEVANGCMESDTQMTLFPLGNGNDYARNFEFTSDPIESVNSLLRRKPIKVSIMEAEKDDETRYAINVVSLGVSGAVADSKLRGEGRWLHGHKKYTYLAIKNLIKWKNPRSKISFNGKTIDFKLTLLAMGLGYSFGAGYKVLPGASPLHDKMHVTWADGLPRYKLPGLMKKIEKGTHIEHPQVYIDTTDEIVVESEKPLTAELEGEWMKKTPFMLRIANKKLKILTEPNTKIYKLAKNT